METTIATKIEPNPHFTDSPKVIMIIGTQLLAAKVIMYALVLL